MSHTAMYLELTKTLRSIRETVEETDLPIDRDEKTTLVVESIKIANAAINRPTAPPTQNGD